MNILICCIHHPICLGRFMSDAFTRLGHTVKHIGSWVDDSDWIPDGDWNDVIYDFIPDLVCHMDTVNQAWEHPLFRSIPHIHYQTTGHVVTRIKRLNGNRYEHYFAAHFDKQGKNETVLPCAYDPTLHTPAPIDWDNRTYDVCLIGRDSQHRQRLVHALREAGLNVFRGAYMDTKQYVRYYQDSRISLIHFENTVGMRLFESAAMDVNLLCNVEMPLSDLGVIGYTGYDNEYHAIRQAVWLLQNAGVAKILRGDARKWARAQRWDDRAQTIINWYKGTYDEPE